MKTSFAGCLLSIASLVVGGCHGSDLTSTAPIQTVRARVVVGQQQQVPVGLTATGSIHAKETAIIASQITGSILQVLVREGDRVRAGQILIVVDDAFLSASSSQAEAAAKAAASNQAAAQSEASLATSTLARYRQLQSERSISPQEMDEISRRAEAAAARLEAAHSQNVAAQAQERGARTMQSYTRLRAPFSGVVTARMADPGMLASPGAALLQVEQAGPLQLQVPVDESAIGAIHKGLKVHITFSGISPADTLGTVSEIDPAADPASHSFAVKIDLPLSDTLHSGIYGTAEFATGTRQAILVARTSVLYNGSLTCAYVVDGQGLAQLRYLTLGAVHGDVVEVLSGVTAGEKLVDSPSDRDLAGKRIEVQP